MPFARPTIDDLYQRAIADIETDVPGADARVRRSMLGVFSKVLAAAAYGLYGFIDWVSKQIIPDTAEAAYLERWASIWGVYRKSATAAAFPVLFTGANGVIIPAGTLVQRPDGVEYATQNDGVVTAGSISIPVVAAVAGAAQSLASGVTVSLVSPVPGIDPTATTQTGGTAGQDQETDAELLARLLARIQSPPQGGSASDYVEWALLTAGVTRAWCTPLEFGIGTVGLTFVRDDDGTGAAIIPSSGAVTAMQAALDALRPVTASLTVYAPTAALDAFTIHLSTDTPANRAGVLAELQDLYLRTASPGATVKLSQIVESAVRGAGGTDVTIVSPVANVTHTAHRMPIVGTIAWV